jgi:hypothetical membrane protein
MSLNALHSILFNMEILYSLILGIWAAMMAFRNQPISGNYWGAVATGTVLAVVIVLVGIIMTVEGYRTARIVTYYIYMSWLVIVMPGLYSMLRGRDDRSAAIAFSLLSLFNAATSTSMLQRGITGPWILQAA